MKMRDGFVVADNATLASTSDSALLRHSLQTSPPLSILHIVDAHSNGFCAGSFVSFYLYFISFETNPMLYSNFSLATSNNIVTSHFSNYIFMM